MPAFNPLYHTWVPKVYSSVSHKCMKSCKTCNKNLSEKSFSQIKRQNSITYRQSCKACELEKARARRTKNREVSHDNSTDPAFYKDDKDAKMPSDSDMLFWSTPWYDEIVAGREVLMNKVPEDDKAK